MTFWPFPYITFPHNAISSQVIKSLFSSTSKEATNKEQVWTDVHKGGAALAVKVALLAASGMPQLASSLACNNIPGLTTSSKAALGLAISEIPTVFEKCFTYKSKVSST